MKIIPIPKALLWDYTTPPDDLLWRLQRIDRETALLIEEYYKIWKSKDE